MKGALFTQHSHKAKRLPPTAKAKSQIDTWLLYQTTKMNFQSHITQEETTQINQDTKDAVAKITAEETIKDTALAKAEENNQADLPKKKEKAPLVLELILEIALKNKRKQIGWEEKPAYFYFKQKRHKTLRYAQEM